MKCSVLVGLFLGLLCIFAVIIPQVNAATFYVLIVNNPSPKMGTISPTVGTYFKENNTVITFTAYPNPGYAFVGWLREVPGIQPVITQTNPLTVTPQFTGAMTLQLNVTVMWAPAQVNLTVNTVAHGTTDKDGISQHYALEDITITASPASGYLLDYWDVNGIIVSNYPYTGVSNTTRFSIIENMVVIPHFKLNPVVYAIPIFSSIPNLVGSFVLIGVLGFFGYKAGDAADHAFSGLGVGVLAGIIYAATIGYFPVWILLLISIALGIIVYKRYVT